MLEGQRILLTGASGFVGRRLHSALLAHGAIVDAVTGPSDPGGLDLADETATKDRVSGFGPDAVVHLAAASSVGESGHDQERVWRNNFDATRVLATASAELAVPPHFVFASSAEVYGRSFLLGPCDEDACARPTSAYGRTKAASELHLVDVAGDRMRTTILRLFNHSGPGQDGRFVAPSLARQIARLGVDEQGIGLPGAIQVGNLDAARDFSDVDDIIDAYLCVLGEETSLAGSATFNVGSGKCRNIRSLLDRLIAIHGAPVLTNDDPKRMRASEIQAAAGVFERFHDRFGWKPSRDFDQTLKNILFYERGNVSTLDA